MRRLRQPLQDEAVQVLPGEAHAYPTPGNAAVMHSLRYEVVERPVEMGKRQVDHDLRHRQLRSGSP
jgi:hypothetical protein